LGALGLLVMLALGAFLLTCAFKVIPIYMDYWQTKKAVESVINDGKSASLSKPELVEAIRKQLDIDRIESIKAKDIKFKETRDGRELDASYEKRVELIANVDVVVKFDKLQYPLPSSR
jgi:hypothetical protein